MCTLLAWPVLFTSACFSVVAFGRDNFKFGCLCQWFLEDFALVLVLIFVR